VVRIHILMLGQEKVKVKLLLLLVRRNKLEI
jgi:hypothetical protein